MAGDEESEVVEIGQWNSVVESVRKNSQAINDLKTLPDAVSELKALITQFLPTQSEGESYYEYDDEDIIDVNDGDGSSDVEQDALNLLMANKAGHSDPSLQDILNQTQTEPDYGPNLQDDVALSFGRLINKKISKDTLQKWKDQYMPPDNCKTLGVPRVNHEIWSALPNKTRQSDVHLQGLQNSVSMTSVALAKLGEKIVVEGSQLPGKWQQELLQAVLECATINSVTNQAIISQRKKEIKPALTKEASAICGSNNVTTELLFGNNFQDEIKATKSAMNVIKQRFMKPTFSRGTSRFQPYNAIRPQGNFQRPPQFMQRGGPRPRFQARRSFLQSRPPRPNTSLPPPQSDN